PSIALGLRKNTLDVKRHRARFAERSYSASAELDEFPVRHGQNDGLVSARPRPRLQKIEAIFMIGLFRISPGVEDIDLGVALFKGSNHIDNLGVTKIGAVLFEGQPHDQHTASHNRKTTLHHKPGHAVCNMRTHTIVNASARENDLRVIANLLSTMRQIVGVNPDAVSADQAWNEVEKVPFGARSLQHLPCVEAQPMEDDRKFVHQCNVQISLCIFDHLGCLCDFDRGGLMGSTANDLAIQPINSICGGWRRAAGDLRNAHKPVRHVARIDTLWAVADEKILIKLQPRNPLQNGRADFSRAPGIDSRFVYYDRSPLDDGADGLGSFYQKGEIRPVRAIDGLGTATMKIPQPLRSPGVQV